MAKLTGTCVVRMDGLSLRAKDAELDLGGFERETKYADGKRVGFSEKPKCGMVKCTVIHGNDTDLFKVRDAASVTITFVTDTGVTYTMRDACSTKPPTLKSEGESDMEFEGEPVF